MIETIICEYLTKNIDVKAYPERPKNSPDMYILVEKTGGDEKNHIGSATIAIQSYASSMFHAAKLNEKVKQAMREIVCLDSIAGVHLNNDCNFPDLERKDYRYQAVYYIKHYV